jgi:geranylgeranyl pyrophosphate synthase
LRTGDHGDAVIGYEYLRGDLLRDSGGISYTRQCAVGHVDKAKAALDMLPNNPESAILADIADYALLRKN